MERRRTGIFLLFLGLFSFFHEGCCCGANWLRYGDRCYRFYDVRMTGPEALLRCLEEGSELASISSEGLLHFIAQHAAAHEEGTFFWVGLVGYNETGSLLWLDGVATAQEQPWVSLPSESDGLTFPCFVYNGAAVVASRCSQRYGAICSRSRVERPNRTTGCNVQVHPLHSFVGEATGTCLFKAPGGTTREAAEELCQHFEAHFADLDTIVREGLSSAHFHQVVSDDRYWTSLSHNDTHVFLGKPANAFPYPLQDSGGVGSCVTVQFNFSEALQTHFYRTECSDHANVVCYQDVPRPLPPSSLLDSRPQMDSPELKCPEGYNWKMDSRNNYCYWETSYETEHLSWSDAEAYCQSYGGHLASFHSIDEEKIGLSFQYGSLAHPYWIGLSLDVVTETYVWSDGSPLDYSNWAPGHPNHRDKRLRCVAMEAQEKHWVSSLCGILSWFVCKVPKQARHYTVIRPTPAPLEPCDQGDTRSSGRPPYRFGGSCYSTEVKSVSWHEAKSHCEDQGALLVSLHTADEVGFLLKLLHESSLDSNRVWIGLNSFGLDGELRWADWTPLDFTYFGDRPQDSPLYQEKCYNMNVNNGQWNNENCNAALGFVCKWVNESVTTPLAPPTADPRIGNCKKGWMPYDDRCYYFGGVRTKDRVNWTEAARLCRDQGGDLTSVRDDKEQAFLSYMLQSVGADAWIGFHDKIQTGRYYWLDNSEVKYTNWAVGEPSFFGITEECVKLVFDHLESGVWKDDDCDRTYGYICQSRRDPSLPKPAYEPSTQCLQPEGWLKLEDACFRLFDGHPLTRDEAEQACRRDGGHLVSISDQKIKAAVQHLAVQLQTDFFIGLQYEASTQRFRWVNDFPVLLSNWEKNEPGVSLDGDTCFASTSEGYWKKAPCDQPLPYMCQITAARMPKQSRYTGQCPETSREWWAGRGSFCYLLEGHTKTDWFTANLMCLRHASHLLSVHSMSEIEDIRKMMGQFGSSAPRSIFLGLMRNKKGGFAWMDDSPVDFVNWEVGEPSSGLEQECVEMMTDTMKWKLTSCLFKRAYLCHDYKDTLVFEDVRTAQYTDAQGNPQVGLSVGAICAIVACIAVGILLLGAALLYRKRRGQLSRGHAHRRHDEGVSFENALYKVGSANMEFHQEEL